jgi:hypothetical protein
MLATPAYAAAPETIPMVTAPLLQLIASWCVIMTLVLIFILIAFGTALSVFGVVKFGHPAQQTALFNGLIMGASRWRARCSGG